MLDQFLASLAGSILGLRRRAPYHPLGRLLGSWAARQLGRRGGRVTRYGHRRRRAFTWADSDAWVRRCQYLDFIARDHARFLRAAGQDDRPFHEFVPSLDVTVWELEPVPAWRQVA